MTCSICRDLTKRLKSFTIQQSALSAAHLRAVQDGDLATARQLDSALTEASDGVHLYAERLRDHQIAHLAHGGRKPPDGHDRAAGRETRWYPLR
jgi:hypothetical protein